MDPIEIYGLVMWLAIAICCLFGITDMKYKTSHQLAHELLLGPDLILAIAVPTFDMPGYSTALPVKATKSKVGDKECILISADE
jgi:hypothetical protein